MANTLLIEKQTGGYFKFTLNSDAANAITSIQNDLLAVGSQLHFKTGNGANIIKEQFIYPEDVTLIAGGVFTFTTVAEVWNKLIDVDYFAWLGGGGNGVDRFDDLLDTFQYNGNAGKAVIVDGSETKLVPITLYNKRLFTELEDTPNDLVPDKMVVVNPAGTALILKDQPKPPEEYLNSVGYFDYNDLATQTTPLTVVANTPKKLTNDTEGANTSTDQNPYGVSFVWDYTTNQFNFNELEVGDTIDVRVHVQVTTTTSNQKVSMSAKFGIGSVSEFTNSIYENMFKSSGTHEVSFVAPFYMGSTYITDYPAELYLTSDASATVKVDGWYVRILRKNINIITVDYEVPDATTLVKGIVRLAGDLAGTANNPTVPELVNKVSKSRNINTTSPLLGGGDLNSDLTLSIQLANSTHSGYLNNVDWSHFDSAYNDKIVSAAVTGTTTKTLTLGQLDGGTITTTWSDDNSVTSVFGRTGAVVAVSGDYSTSLVTEGTNLYYTESRVSANTDVAANTAKRHDAATLGTSNGLSLSGQVLSLALSGASSTGALSSTDWNTFNSKQGALDGTGFVKVSGTTVSYDNTNYVPTSRTLTINGTSYDLSANRSWTIDGVVTSVFGRTGDVVAVSGDYSTSLVTESTDKNYQTDSQKLYNDATSSIQTQLNSKQANLSGTGIVKSVGGTISYLTDNTANWDDAYNNKIVTAAVTGTGTKTLTLNQQDGGTVTASWTDEGDDLTFSSPLVNTAGLVSIPVATSTVNGYLSSTDWTTFNSKQGALDGTGFVKVSGTTVSYDNSVYALDNAVVHLSGAETISGVKTFTGSSTVFDYTGASRLVFKADGTDSAEFSFSTTFTQITSKASGGYLFKNSIGANSLQIESNGNGTFSGSITASSIIKLSGTSSEFLKADGSVDNTTYVPSSRTISTTSPLSGGGDLSSNRTLSIAQSSSSANGYLSSTDWTTFNAKPIVGGGFDSGYFSGDNVIPAYNVSANTIYPSNIQVVTYGSSPITRARSGDDTSAGGVGFNIYNQSSGAFNKQGAKISFSQYGVLGGAYIGVPGSVNDLTFGSVSSSGVLSEKMRIMVGGNVGIGTTSPDNKLDVRNTVSTQIRMGTDQGARPYWNIGRDNVTTGNFVIADETSIKMSITNGGNVGIGTTSPIGRLHVVDSANFFVASFTGGGSANSLALGTAEGVPSIAGYSSAGASTNVSINPYGGNVGIGTTSPGAFRLNVSGRLGNFSSENSSWLAEFSNTGTTDAHGMYVNIGASSTGIPFAVYKNFSPFLFINNSGNVGIGTTSPTAKLTISGFNAGCAIDMYNTSAAQNYRIVVNSVSGALALENNSGAEAFKVTQGASVGIGGGDDINNAGIDKLSFGHYNGNYGWFQTWGGTSLYLNKLANAVYAGTQRIDNNSDIRIKENIEPIQGALDTVLLLQGKKYNMLDEDNILRYGFIAQEVQPHLSDFVTESDRSFEKDDVKIENLLTLESSGAAWAALLVEAIKEQQKQIEELKTLINK